MLSFSIVKDVFFIEVDCNYLHVDQSSKLKESSDEEGEEEEIFWFRSVILA